MLPDPPGDPTMEAAATRSRESGALIFETRQGFRNRQEKKKEYARESTLTPKPFAAASPPCGSGPPSRSPHPAWSPPPRPWASSAGSRTCLTRRGASARRPEQEARQKNPRRGRTPAGGVGRFPPRRHPISRRNWLQARSRLLRRQLRRHPPRCCPPWRPPPSRGPPSHAPPGRGEIGDPPPLSRPQVEGEGSAKTCRLVRVGQEKLGDKTKRRKDKASIP